MRLKWLFRNNYDYCFIKKISSFNHTPAAIDTFAYKKNKVTSPLRGLDNIILTPHIAGSTKETLEKSARQIVENIAAIVEDCWNVPIVNEEVLEYKSKADLKTLPSVDFH